MTDRPLLRAIAERLNILSVYEDMFGVAHETADSTREALLAAMGFDASTEEAAARAAAALDREERDQLLAPVRVVREEQREAVAADAAAGDTRRKRSGSSPQAGRRSPDDRAKVRIRVPEGVSGAVNYRVELWSEKGTAQHEEGRLTLRRSGGRDPSAVGPPPASLSLPWTPSSGYHVIRLELHVPGRDLEGLQRLIVTPGSCMPVAERLGERRVFGVWSSLYTLRSRRNRGMGDLTDLTSLVRFARERGADFVGINPLHAVRNRGGEISPYTPVTRLFRDPLYLDVSAVPELADCAEARERIASDEFIAEVARLERAPYVDREALLRLQIPLWRALHGTFVALHRDQPTPRGRSYAEFLKRSRRGGDALTDYATFLALESHFERTQGSLRGWRNWPSGYQAPSSRAVEAFREEQAEEVDLHRYLQFEIDRQLGAAADAAGAAGMKLGLYQDLALGTAPGGSDLWAFPGLFLDGATVGAPPDDFSAVGQNWALPPVDPRVLRRTGYRYWIQLLRAAFAHAGALRIDHVMGLFRQFWIPAGRPGTEGAYVRFPADDLLGILALESRRNRAVVVGEDLGTVPHGLRSTLARWEILSSRVLYFEQDAAASFLPATRYPRAAMVTANTHDLPPLAGFWRGRDLELRRRAGHLKDDQELAAAEARRARERAGLFERLTSEACLPPGSAARPEDLSIADLVTGVSAFIGQTPSALAGVSLDDLGGEAEPVNLPGVGLDSYPSWSRRMSRSLEEIFADPLTVRALEACERGREREVVETSEGDSGEAGGGQGRENGSGEGDAERRPETDGSASEVTAPAPSG